MDDHIQKLIQTSTYKGLSSDEEKQLLKYLRSLPEVEAYEIIKYMIEQKSWISHTIAKRVLNKKNYVTKVFKYGIVNSNAQSIKLWLEFAIPKLGFKSVTKLVQELSNDSNQLLEKALYWFPIFIAKDDINLQNLLKNLKHGEAKE